ncbi:hypothetical protein BCR36DRAFT_64634 [Piromyces finnis]|uniref:Uncharacterized protein n=1 Tax=Piromyces finnis TaxID=1754191 RepID=A0A1Y1V992_9FUNG|nr:hypothetical protein BCR36DRAFT_64634 [Piromyces finnis]|eukprot:ORX49615.1 hypothetical protein BCR36DRAFT_64634 [Piromyces finnis]
MKYLMLLNLLYVITGTLGKDNSLCINTTEYNCEEEEKKKENINLIIIVICILVLVFVLLITLIIIGKKRKNKKNNNHGKISRIENIIDFIFDIFE